MKFHLLALISSTNALVHFKEQFTDLKNWTPSTWKSSSELQEFQLESHAILEDNLALATTQDARFYASSATFEKTISNKGKSLLLQYEVTYEKDVECGGGYLKMGPKMEDPTKFGDPTEYAVMFGPDKCGHQKRTHLIFNYKGKNVLKKVDLPYKQDEEGVTTLYRMILHPDNSVLVDVNGENIYKGTLEADWDLLASKEIDDPEDKKPSDWVDDAMIDDSSDTKPSDWVEIKEIVDSTATQPADWDEEEDGAWEAPMKPNPDYKGEWQPKRISNPEYKGVWSPKKIPNPDYQSDDELYLLNGKELGFIGFDLWQVKGGSRFDNVMLSLSEDKAKLVKEADDWTKIALKKRDDEKKKKESTTTTTTTTENDTADEEDKDDDDL